MSISRQLLPGLLALSASACGAQGTGAPERTVVEVWSHAGQQGERTTLEAQAARFNAADSAFRVHLTFLPEDTYDGQVQASAVAGRLPDLLELDGPYVATYAWQGRLRPLASLLTDSLRATLLPSIVSQGTWRDTLWAVGAFDSGLGIYARRSALQAAGVRVPRGPGDAWSATELGQALDRLAARDPDGAVLDLKLNYQGEWFTYAFQPMLRSAGGGLVRQARPPQAAGVLNGLASVSALSAVQGWIEEGRVDPNLDDAAFTEGRVALSVSGHWDYPRYAAALGDDLVLLPLPDFGNGTRSGQGSWVWTVPRSSAHPEAAAAFLSFLLRPEEILDMTRANGAVPATTVAAARSDLYRPGGPLHLFLAQLAGGWTVPRPRTPAYPVITSVFQQAFDQLRDGGDVAAALGAAAAAIDQEVADNRGYPSW